MEKPIRIAIVAGEDSGDTLGAGLIRAIKSRQPHAEFFGIGGEKMLAEGFVSHCPMERLSVMGLTEVLGRLPELLSIRKSIHRIIVDSQADVVIGIDAPDFNLGLEHRLRQSGIPTVHYVSPSVWAWRQGRIKKIKKAVDHMLTLLPFEADFYRQHGVPVTFVGHTLANQLPRKPVDGLIKVSQARQSETRTLVLMPGSRRSEIEQLGRLFLQVAEQVFNQLGSLTVIIPTPNADRTQQVKSLLAVLDLPFPVEVLEKGSDDALQRCDGVLVASGTATLQAMLLKVPMVVAYRVSTLTYAIMSRLVKTPWVSLPNILEQKEWVPERIQDSATVDQLTVDVVTMLSDESYRAAYIRRADYWHGQLALSADDRAADVVLSMVSS